MREEVGGHNFFVLAKIFSLNIADWLSRCELNGEQG